MNFLALKQFSAKALWPKSLALPFNLQRRDKLALSAAGAALILFLILQLVVFPIMDRRTHLRDQLRAKTVALQNFQDLAAEYQNMVRNARGTEDRIRKRPREFTLFSYLDSLAGSSGIKQNIVYMKPSTSNVKSSPYTLSIVELKIQSLTMEQLVNFLNRVENANELVWIKRMSIAKEETKTGAGLLTAVLQAETYQK